MTCKTHSTIQTISTMTSPSLLQSQAISALMEARRSVLSAARSLPQEARPRIFLGTWSVLDLLAHLTGWDHTNMQAAREVMKGRVPSFYAHRDKDWQTYNSMLVKKYKHGSFDDLVAQAERSHLQLVDFLKSIPAESFGRDFGVRFRGYKVIVLRLVEAEARDELVHAHQIHEFARSLSPLSEL